MEVEVKIEPFEENGVGREGLIAEGTYIWDAMRRLGVYFELEDDEDCTVKIKSGESLLSAPTKIEQEKLGEAGLNEGQRLAKQTKIIASGELVFMPIPPTEEEKEETPQEAAEKLRIEFAKLPFDQKFATITQMEAITLGETLNFVFGLPNNIASRFVDFLATFGRQKDFADRQAKRPAEHFETAETTNAETSEV